MSGGTGSDKIYEYAGKNARRRQGVVTGEGSRRFAGGGAVTKTGETSVEENRGGMSKAKWTEVFGKDAKRDARGVDEKTATDRDGWPTRFRGIKEKKVLHWRAFLRGTT